MSEAYAPLLPANDALPPDAPPASPEDAIFQATSSGEIQDLIECPCRTLEVEYKSWRNLDHPEDRAELARDIAALANHGGGFIVFGFDENTLLPDDTDPFRTNCTTERVRSIVAAYLDPPVSCEVALPRSSVGVIHPVIRVAGHETTPICIRQDGPPVDGGRLVERGAFYTRKHAPFGAGHWIGSPRPQSSKIEVPQDWAPIIRRCVRSDRESLLGILDAAIEGRITAPAPAQRLLRWHQAAHDAFLTLVPRSPVAGRLARCHYALSYNFELLRPEMLEHAQLPERLRRTVFEVQTQFGSAWRMFDPPYRRAVQARFVLDPAAGDDDVDFLEAAWLRARNPGDEADFWRVSPKGLATIIRPYPEDQPQSPGLDPVQPGTCLSPSTVAQEVAELVCHARAFSRLFAGVRSVAFRCEWWGLAGRALFDPEGQWPHRGPALSNRSVATVQVPLTRLAQAWPEIVAQLIAPPVRAVEADVTLDAEWVRRQSQYWAKPPG